MTPFAARDILTAVKEALEIVKERGVQALFGAPSVWATVRHTIQRYQGETPEVTSHLARAKAGQTVLAWLAEILPHLNQYSTPVLASGHDVISWLLRPGCRQLWRSKNSVPPRRPARL